MEICPLISAMSSAPMLLAKEGVLSGGKFTSGLFEETINGFDYIEKKNIVRQPLVYDESHNILTAISFVFREFAIKSGQLLGLETDDNLFLGPRKNSPYEPKELIFYMDN